ISVRDCKKGQLRWHTSGSHGRELLLVPLKRFASRAPSSAKREMLGSLPLKVRRTKRWVTRALNVCPSFLLGHLLAVFPPLQPCLHPETTIKSRRVHHSAGALF